MNALSLADGMQFRIAGIATVAWGRLDLFDFAVLLFGLQRPGPGDGPVNRLGKATFSRRRSRGRVFP